MISGAGIDYSIKYKKSTTSLTWKTAKEGSCASNKSFTTYTFSSPTGYSTSLKLTETQHDKKDPGIGWGRIDY